MSLRLSSSLAFFWLSLIWPLEAQERPTTVTVAAAADLTAAEPDLASAFERATPGLKVRFVTGASAALAQQIQNGAPFDVFLSANIDLVDMLNLEEAKVYTVGHVAVLWRDGKAHDLKDLASPSIRYVALPNPRLAPYGLAAQNLLQRAGLWISVQPKIVYGENVRQALQLFDSGNADTVLTAAALVTGRHPQILPAEVVQKGGIVRSSKEVAAAKQFWEWLLSPTAQEILRRYGFETPSLKK